MARRGGAGFDRAEAERVRQETLEAMHAQLAAEIGKLSGQGEWQRWLAFAASFTRFSFNNTLLIWAQRPDATLVAGYRAWQAKGRQVRRGEKAIKVLGPVTKRVEVVDAAGHPVRDPSGKPLFETRMVGVKPVSVFDVSQTDGDPLPARPEPVLLTGQAPVGLWQALQGFIEAQGYTVSRGDCDGANGVTRFDTREVRVRADLDDAASCKTLCHEAGHVVLHAPQAREPFTCRGVAEVEAESVAYLLTRAHGLDSSQYTFNYVTGWAHEAISPGGPSVEELVRATGVRVIGATDQILRATQPAPTVVEVALADLTVSVEQSVALARTPAVADLPSRLASPAGRTPFGATTLQGPWERVDPVRVEASARHRAALPVQSPSPTVAVAR